MAKNLQAKLPATDTLRLFDINTATMEKLAGEMKASLQGGAAGEMKTSPTNGAAGETTYPTSGAAVEMAESAADTAKDAVSSPAPTPMHRTAK